MMTINKDEMWMVATSDERRLTSMEITGLPLATMISVSNVCLVRVHVNYVKIYSENYRTDP